MIPMGLRRAKKIFKCYFVINKTIQLQFFLIFIFGKAIHRYESANFMAFGK